jgi:hypothetical protein
MASMHNVFGRTPDISDNSKGPIVNLVAWIAMVTMCLSVITVLVSKYIMLRKLSWNEYVRPQTWNCGEIDVLPTLLSQSPHEFDQSEMSSLTTRCI